MSVWMPTVERRRRDQRHQSHASPTSIAPPPATTAYCHAPSTTKSARKMPTTSASAAG